MGGHYRHELDCIIQVILEDLKQLKGMTVGELMEDIRAAFNDGNRALNGLTDIEFSRIRSINVTRTYPFVVVEAKLEVRLDRRYSIVPGTVNAGATNPRTIAKAIVTRLDADADFDGVTFYEQPPSQPSKWPACWIEQGEQKPLPPVST